MLRLIFSRLALAVPVLVCVSIVAFVLLRLAPGDPAQLQAGVDAGPEMVAAVRHELALDQPWPVQYAAWASKVAQGDLGVSYSAHLPVTAQISGTALVLIVVIGVPLGIVSALHKDRSVDQTVRVVSLLGISVPN